MRVEQSWQVALGPRHRAKVPGIPAVFKRQGLALQSSCALLAENIKMNFSDVIKTLNQASAFELYRMRAAIDRVLDEPRWMQAIQARVKLGQTVQYFDSQANALKRGQVLELRRKQAVVLDLDDGKRWIISYAAINLDGLDVEIREQKSKGLGRNEVAIGDVVGFLDRDQQQRTGKIIRLNDKTVTLQSGQGQWRVAYSYLHRVVDATATMQGVIEMGEVGEVAVPTPHR